MKIALEKKTPPLHSLYGTGFGTCFRMHVVPGYWPGYYMANREKIENTVWMLTGEYYRDKIDDGGDRQLMIVNLDNGSCIGIHRHTKVERLNGAEVVL